MLALVPEILHPTAWEMKRCTDRFPNCHCLLSDSVSITVLNVGRCLLLVGGYSPKNMSSSNSVFGKKTWLKENTIDLGFHLMYSSWTWREMRMPHWEASSCCNKSLITWNCYWKGAPGVAIQLEAAAALQKKSLKLWGLYRCPRNMWLPGSHKTVLALNLSFTIIISHVATQACF